MKKTSYNINICLINFIVEVYMKTVQRQRNENKDLWYKMDNSAIVYTSTRKNNYANVFRLGIIMKEIIDPVILQQAYEDTLDRFPYFAVRLRAGLFWNYWETNKLPYPKVIYDNYDPCLPIYDKSNNYYPVKILYYKKRISFECFHALTDGFGGTVFLKTLVAQYLRLKGFEITTIEGTLDINEEMDDEEYEDAYFKYANSGRIMGVHAEKAYKFQGTPISDNLNTCVISGVMELKPLMELAKKHNVTLNEYLTAIILSIFYEKQNTEMLNPEILKERKVLRVGVPINLRQFFKTKSLCNFILLLTPYIDPAIEDYTFEEILRDVKQYMAFNKNPKYLKAKIAKNIKTQTNVFTRPFPLFIKSFIVALFYKRLADKQVSSVFTNLGIFKIPEEMEEHIERAEILMGRPFSYSSNCGIISVNGIATISFTSKIMETDIEMEFFRFLVKQGIHVKIISNR